MRLPSVSTFVAVPLTLAAAVATAPAQATLAGVGGAQAIGSATGTYIVGCTTCPSGVIAMSGDPDQAQGGPGQTSAQVQYAGQGLTHGLLPDVPDAVSGGATYEAMALLSGVAGSPLLRARVTTDNEQVLRPTSTGVQFVGIDAYSVFAQAEAAQRYTYLGSTASTYTFSFQFDGVLQGSLGSASARAGFYAIDDPFLEVALAGNGDFVQGSEVSGAFVRSFDVSIDLNPGDEVLLLGSLSAGVQESYSSEDTSVDVFNTFKVTGIAGDLSLLAIGLTSPTGPGGGTVPVPATAALAAWGLLAVALRRRRR